MTKSLGQKVSYLFAVISLLAALAATVAAIVYEPRTEMDPIQASLMASAFFFGSCAVVLYVIGTARLKGDPSKDGDR
jgi:TRAP-type C4-dicarboxylate transport system permease small subunit